MKRTPILIGMLSLLLPTVVFAQASDQKPLFDRFYDEAGLGTTIAAPSKDIQEYIVKEMRNWQTDGVVIKAEDVEKAMALLLWTDTGDGLCQNKKNTKGGDIEFTQGGPETDGSCLALRQDIMDLLRAEQQADELGSDLLMLANGSELAIADEPGRPVNMPVIAQLLRRVWSGTGAAAIPWEKSADDDVKALTDHLKNAGADIDKIMLRFHHGYFRDTREKDPRFQEIGTDIADDLKKIAEKLKITGDPTAVGVYQVPGLKVDNITLWVRKDDLGLQWTTPSTFTRLSYEAVKTYPSFKQGGEKLAYPFDFQGTVPTDARITSPLCSRAIGREGYLCRPLSSADPNCENPESSDEITLVKCGQSDVITQHGPQICAEFEKLFADTGKPLVDPANPGKIDPTLTKALPPDICFPGNKTLYQDDITSHACYVGYCMLQSLNGHTLVPNRSPVVANEMTSPYLACMRPDPQLGLYTEIAKDVPYILPEYLGPLLVRDYERQACAVSGDAPQPLLGLCMYNDNAIAAAPLDLQSDTTGKAYEEAKSIRYRQQLYGEAVGAVGQRASLNQTIELTRKAFGKFSSFVQQIADLFLELKRAPLTTTSCPWTGPFPSLVPPESTK